MPDTILVVDDDAVTRRVLQHYLGRAGFDVIAAQNGRDALKQAKRELPHLVILDVVMPDMDGWTVLKAIRDSEVMKSIPVIMLSGNAELVTKPESLNSSAQALLVKPINPEQLIMVIRRLLPRPASRVCYSAVS
jgi:DNA-binding response OmpR family regulator